MSRSPSWDAIVLAGGRGERMGGADKVALTVGGTTMLNRVLAAVSGAGQVVVVGPQRATAAPVVWCREEPPGGGPAAAVAAALPHVTADTVVLLAADQPLITAADVALLLDALAGADAVRDGAVAVDEGQQPQWLCSAWHTVALRGAPLGPGLSLQRALDPLVWTPAHVAPEAMRDCDTVDDLQRVRELNR